MTKNERALLIAVAKGVSALMRASFVATGVPDIERQEELSRVINRVEFEGSDR